MPLHAFIPQEREASVVHALLETFGRRPVSSMHPLRGGVSGATLLQFSAGGGSYVLRIEPLRIRVEDRRRGFISMAAAAQVGAAPKVRFADADAGVLIMDFITERPLTNLPGGRLALMQALGDLIARVQTTPLFPSLGDYPCVNASLLGDLALRAAGRLGDLDRHRQGLERLTAALAWDPRSVVSAHNDPNTRNLLFDGERLWLVDWEMASANDPLVDIAILTAEQAPTAELEIALMRAAFGYTPDRRRLARLRAIRTLTWLFYGCVVLNSLGPTPPSGFHFKATTLKAFRAAVRDGRLISGSPEVAYAFGLTALATFVHETEAPEFAKTLQILSQG